MKVDKPRRARELIEDNVTEGFFEATSSYRGDLS